MRVLALFLLLACCSGCSSYNRAWKSYTPPADDALAGRWEGEWRSTPSGHSGKLRCLMRPNEDGTYEAWFRSTWKVVLVHKAKTTLSVSEADQGHALKGSQDLGKLFGGVFHHEGTVVGDDFRATYKNAFDHGVMEMDRFSAGK